MTGEKVAIVTGGSSGLGLAITRAMLQSGFRVAITGRSQERLEAVCRSLDAGETLLPIQADVASEDDVLRTFAVTRATLGLPRVIVNNAGQTLICRVAATDLAQWNAIMATHATGTFLMAREAVRAWLDGKHEGCIVNIASVSARTGAPLAAAYAAAKSAVMGFSRSLAREVAAQGIRVNVVCPGAMDTPMFHEGTLTPLVELYGRDRESLLRGTLSMIPQRRLLDPAEVADMVMYLVSNSAHGITGQAFNVDGGYDMR